MSLPQDRDSFMKMTPLTQDTQKNEDYPCLNSILSPIFVRFKAFL